MTYAILFWLALATLTLSYALVKRGVGVEW